LFHTGAKVALSRFEHCYQFLVKEPYVY
jgi:hypothetical protein